MRYDTPVWVLFRTGRSHLVWSWLQVRGGSWSFADTACGRRIDIQDPLLDCRPVSGFDDRACQQCRAGWDE